jgi:hypothetical protein
MSTACNWTSNNLVNPPIFPLGLYPVGQSSYFFNRAYLSFFLEYSY